MENATAQAVGFLAVAAFLISYQIKSNRALFLCQMIGSGQPCCCNTTDGAGSAGRSRRPSSAGPTGLS